MKKIIVLLMMVVALFISGNSLFANAYDDCFELENLKEKSDGFGAAAAAEQASQTCEANRRYKRGKVYFTSYWNLSGSTKSRVTCTGRKCGQTNVSGDSTDKGMGIISLGYKFPFIPLRVSRHIRNNVGGISTGSFIVDFVARNGFYIGMSLPQAWANVDFPRDIVVDGDKIQGFVTAKGRPIVFNTGFEFSISQIIPNTHLDIGILINRIILDSAPTETDITGEYNYTGVVDTFSTFVGVKFVF